MEKINIAELLRYCPKGMELDSTLFDDIYFDCIDDVCDIIKCYIQESKHKIGISFDKCGHCSNISKSKCVIFPKGKTTWEGFTPPCQFKVGDKVVFRDAKEKPLTIRKIWWDCQAREILCSFEEDDIDVPVEDLDRYIKPKFNINTLKPFESRVLMRSSNAREWVGTIFSHYNNNKFYGCGMYCDQCIPYEGNEHLLGTTNDCDEYYKNW